MINSIATQTQSLTENQTETALLQPEGQEKVIEPEQKPGADENIPQEEPIPAVVAEMNQMHAVVNVGGKCRVMAEVIDPDTKLSDILLSSPADFRAFYSNRKVPTSNGRDTTLGAYWFTHPKRREYKGITFNPKETPDGYYNLWTGFAVDPKKGDCSRFLAHIRENIASGNTAIYDYIVAWMAQAIQHPDELLGVALVLRGSMGTGKGVFANGFGSLFGRHYLPLAQSSQLTGKFNAHMKDKCLLFADESFWAGDKQAEGILKALITEPYLVIEGKGENAFKIKNHLHFIFATNNDWCVPAGPRERRFFVLDVGEKRMQDHDYFAAIQKELNDGGREALLHYLLNLDIRNRNLRQFPQTHALLEQKIYSMTPIQKFWFGKLSSGSLGNAVSGWEDEIPTRDLYQQFLDFAGSIGVRHKPSDSEFGTQIRKLAPDISTGKGRTSRYGSIRPNVYKVPSLEECRVVFEEFINYKVEWPVFDETTPSPETTTPETSNQ